MNTKFFIKKMYLYFWGQTVEKWAFRTVSWAAQTHSSKTGRGRSAYSRGVNIRVEVHWCRHAGWSLLPTVSRGQFGFHLL